MTREGLSVIAKPSPHFGEDSSQQVEVPATRLDSFGPCNSQTSRQ